MRKPRMKKVLNLAYQLTRLQAWDGWFMKFIQRWIIPLVGDGKVADHFAVLVRSGHKLDFVPVPPHIEGTVPFDDEKHDVVTAKANGAANGKPTVAATTAALNTMVRKSTLPHFGSVIRSVLMPWAVLSSAILLGAFYQFASVRAQETGEQ